MSGKEGSPQHRGRSRRVRILHPGPVTKRLRLREIDDSEAEELAALARSANAVRYLRAVPLHRPATTAERGSIDSVFLPDSPGVAEFRTEYPPGPGLNPLQILSSVATATERVGLIATMSTTYSYPWEVGRRLATLDFLSRGRTGWNTVSTAEPAAAGNFGDLPHPRRRTGTSGPANTSRSCLSCGTLGRMTPRSCPAEPASNRPRQAVPAAAPRQALRRLRLPFVPAHCRAARC
jgi:hypothetical protein